MTALVKLEKISKCPELAVIEQVVLQGDLSKLTPEQRVTYYHEVCKSVGLNPFTRPFEYISLQGKLTLYVKKDGTEQLRKINGVSISNIESKIVDDLCVVTATAITKDGRSDTSTGAVTMGNLKGDAKANALMKAETKAKRRVTLSICGMGWLDESEIDSIPSAKRVNVDMNTGELKNEEIDVKPLYMADAISFDQAKELSQILVECSEEHQKGFMEYIKKSFQTDSIDGIPQKDYERMKKILIKKRDEHQKALAEKEMTITLTTEG